MKFSRNAFAVATLLIVSCVLVVVAIQLSNTPVVQTNWSGPATLKAVTPTPTLYPAQGWWTSMLTDPGITLPTKWTPKPSWTPKATWTQVPTWTPVFRGWTPIVSSTPTLTN